MNVEYIMKEMWKTLINLPIRDRDPIAQKLANKELLSEDEYISLEAAFYIAYNVVHGED